MLCSLILPVLQTKSKNDVVVLVVMWENATTLDEMIPLNIKWLKQEINVHPQWNLTDDGRTIFDETIPLVDDLIRLNKLGYLTITSQPTDKDDQLALVIGCTTLNTSYRVREKVKLYSDQIHVNMSLTIWNNVPLVRIDCRAAHHHVDFWKILIDMFSL